MSDREKDSIIDMNNNGSIKFDPQTGLCTTMGFVDFTQPLKSTNADVDDSDYYEEDDESDNNRDDCAMKTDSIANKFFIFLWNCLTACECGKRTEDAHHQYDILSNALNDILDTRGNVALKFEHLLGWTAAATHHGLSALLSSVETHQQNRTLFKRVADEWKKVLDKTASSTVVGIDLAYHKFAIWMCGCFQRLLKEARKEYADHAKYTFNFIRKPRVQKGQSASAIANAVAKSNTAFASSTTSHIMTVDTTPAIVTVTVIKPSKNVKLGLGIGQKAGQSGILVNSIAPGSLFANTDLKVGMTLRSIDGRGYSSFQEGLALVKGAEGTLTIVAANLKSSSPFPSRSASTPPVPIPRRSYTYPIPGTTGVPVTKQRDNLMPPERNGSVESYQNNDNDLGSSTKSSMSDSDDEWKTSDMDDG